MKTFDTNTFTRLENRLARFYANFPVLPQAGRRWLATNAWWLILIIAILNAIGCLSLAGSFFGQLAQARQTVIYSVGFGAFIPVQTALSLLAGIVGTIIYFSAVRPLKDMRRLGWRLVFYAQLIGIGFSLLAVVLGAIILRSPLTVAGMLVGFVIGIAFTLLWLYFVFQIRDEFGSRASTAVEAEIIPPKKSKK